MRKISLLRLVSHSFSNPVFLAIFYYPKPVFFQLPYPVILKILKLLLHLNISDSDNTGVASWGV